MLHRREFHLPFHHDSIDVHLCITPPFPPRDRRGHVHMVVGFTTTYVINVYHHKRCEFESGEVY
jgi:hypothetical protein